MARILPLSYFKNKARNGISSFLGIDEEDEEYQPPEDVQQAREGYLESLQGQKRRDISDFFADKPEQPELDTERRKNLKNLAKIDAISSFIDAASQAVLRGRSDSMSRVQPVVDTGGGDLGLTAFDFLRQQETDYADRMDRYRRELSDVEQYNRELEFSAEQSDRKIDTQLAETELSFALQDQAAQAAAEQAKAEAQQERHLADREAYLEAGYRLISQGQERAAMVSLSKAGLSGEEITQALQSDEEEELEVDPTTKRMVDEYKRLREKIGQKEGHYGLDGTAISPEARELEQLRDELGRDLYNPVYFPNQQDRGLLVGKNKQLMSALGQSSGKERQEIMQQLYKNGQKLGLSKEEVDQELQQIADPESAFNQYQRQQQAAGNRGLVQQIQSTSDKEEARKLIDQWKQQMKKQGYSDEQIQDSFSRLMGGSAQPQGSTPDNAPQASEETDSEPPGQGTASPQLPSGEGQGDTEEPPEISKEELDRVVSRIEYELARGEPGDLSREFIDFLGRMTVGVDTQGRRFKHSIGDIAAAPFTTLGPFLWKQLKEQYEQGQEQAKERREELIERFLEQRNQPNEQ